MSLLKGTTVVAQTMTLPKGEFTFKPMGYNEVDENPILDKKGYVALKGFIPELKTIYTMCLFENNIVYTLSELKEVYFSNEDITDIGILDTIIGLDMPIWVTNVQSPTDATKVFTNIHFKKPLTIQADELMSA